MVSTRSSSAAFARRSETPPPRAKTPRKSTRSARKSSSAASASPVPGGWSHAPGALAKIWLAVSLPLVAWDTGYVLLRPHSFPGGWAHWPLWVPYALYGQVDRIYGVDQWSNHNGFTGAQGLLNLIESLMYAVYLWLYFTYAVPGGAASRGKKVLTGRTGGAAVLIAFTAYVMTLSKTVLYWLNEYYSGFDNIGHNTVTDLIFLWIIPNGAWLVFPSIIIATLGSEIVDGLAAASDLDVKAE